jgi:transcriptional/translational regulatory protein YebC/TACO1
MFPSHWSQARIIEEVTHAVQNNHGLVAGKTSLYFGYSKNGLIEIHFAFNPNGKGTYYGIKKNY